MLRVKGFHKKLLFKLFGKVKVEYSKSENP